MPQRFWNQCFDKGRLKNFVLWFFANYGEHKTVELLENLKNIGFEFATKAGISLGIDDLKIPPKKTLLIAEAEKHTKTTINQYKRGEITGVERFQRLIDTWHRTSESLKQEVIEHFQTTDILNPVYMMAFSGARGNISQVRQLVGMRGLMADPQGQILDFPIRSNFREGLTLTEYIISCYGARKGIVDTALRTANAGYLTRRLVDVAQHVIIAHFDCETKRGIVLTDMKEGNKTIYSLSTRLVGRVLAHDVQSGTGITIGFRNQEISSAKALELTKNQQRVFVRSPLTCESRQLVCQLCYGWSLAQGNIVSMGEAVGIIAAQSIGEPGTQLTMRTFHTGGVFSGDITDQIKATFDGIATYPRSIPGTLIRTSEGKIAFLTKSAGIIKVETKLYKIPPFSVLFVRNGEKVFYKQVIAQISNISKNQFKKKEAERCINAEIDGEVFFDSLKMKELLSVLKKGDELTIVKKRMEGEGKINEVHNFFIAKDKLEKEIKEALKKGPEGPRKIDNWTSGYVLSGKIYQSSIPAHFFPKEGDFIGKTTNEKGILNGIKWSSPVLGSSAFLKYQRISQTKLWNVSLLGKIQPRGLTLYPGDLSPDVRVRSLLPEGYSQPTLFWSFLAIRIQNFRFKKTGYIFRSLNKDLFFIRTSLFKESESSNIGSPQQSWGRHTDKSYSRSRKQLFLDWFPTSLQTRSGGLVFCPAELPSSRGSFLTTVIADPANHLPARFEHMRLNSSTAKNQQQSQIEKPDQMLTKRLADASKVEEGSVKYSTAAKDVAHLDFVGSAILLPKTQQEYRDSLLWISEKSYKITNKVGKSIWVYGRSIQICNEQIFFINRQGRKKNEKDITDVTAKIEQQLGYGVLDRNELGMQVHTKRDAYSTLFDKFKGTQIGQPEVNFKMCNAIAPRCLNSEASLHDKIMQRRQARLFCKMKTWDDIDLWGAWTWATYSIYKEKTSIQSQVPCPREKPLADDLNVCQQMGGSCAERDIGEAWRRLGVAHPNGVGDAMRVHSPFLRSPRESSLIHVGVQKEPTSFSSLGPFFIELFLNKKRTLLKEIFNPEVVGEAFVERRNKQHHMLLKERILQQHTKFRKKGYILNCVQKNLRNDSLFNVSSVSSSSCMTRIRKIIAQTITTQIKKKRSWFYVNLLSSFRRKRVSFDRFYSVRYDLFHKKLLFPGKNSFNDLKFDKNILYVECKSVSTNNKPSQFNFAKSLNFEKARLLERSSLFDFEKLVSTGNLVSTDTTIWYKNTKCRFEPLLLTAGVYRASSGRCLYKSNFFENIFSLDPVIEYTKENTPKNFIKILVQKKYQQPFESFLHFQKNHNPQKTKTRLEKIVKKQTRAFTLSRSTVKLQTIWGAGVNILTTIAPVAELVVCRNRKLIRRNLKSAQLGLTFNKSLPEKRLLHFRKKTKQSLLAYFHLYNKIVVTFNLLHHAMMLMQLILLTKSNWGYITNNSRLVSKLLDSMAQGPGPANLASKHSHLDLANWEGLSHSRLFSPASSFFMSRAHEKTSLANSIFSFKPLNLNTFFLEETATLSSMTSQIARISAVSGFTPTDIFFKRSFKIEIRSIDGIQLNLNKNIKYKSCCSFGSATVPILPRFCLDFYLQGPKIPRTIKQTSEISGSQQKFQVYNLFAEHVHVLNNTGSDNTLTVFNIKKSPDQSLRFINDLALARTSISSPFEGEILKITKSECLVLTKNDQISFFHITKSKKISGRSHGADETDKITNERNTSQQPCEVLLDFIPPRRSFAVKHTPLSSGPISEDLIQTQLRSSKGVHKKIYSKTVGFLIGPPEKQNKIRTNHPEINLGDFLVYGDILKQEIQKSAIARNNEAQRLTLGTSRETFIRPGSRPWPTPRTVPAPSFHLNKKSRMASRNLLNFQGNGSLDAVLRQPVTPGLRQKALFFNSQALNQQALAPSEPSIKEHKVGLKTPGQVIHLNKNKITLRRVQPVFLSPNAILHAFNGDFVEKKTPLMTLPFQVLTTGDIVQGIPKIEQLFEARTTKNGRFFKESIPNLLIALYQRYKIRLPLDQAVRQSFYKIQQIIIDGVQRVYRSQGVTIADKHIEIIVKQMTSKVLVVKSGQTGFLPGEILDLDFVEKINDSLIKKIRYEPIILGITKASLEVESFLSAASFQQTTKVLSRAAITKKRDFLKGLKENVIVGNLIPAGTGSMKQKI